MYTSIAFCLLIGPEASHRLPTTPQWVTDYTQARMAGQREGRPLAVLLGSGEEGYNQVSRGGTLSPKVRELLAANYVCVYLDTSRPGARRLADALEVSRGCGLVISDRTGQIQAFHHDGDLSDADLVRNLERFANADGPVRTTESLGRVSYYPPPDVAPARYPPVFFGGGGRSC